MKFQTTRVKDQWPLGCYCTSCDRAFRAGDVAIVTRNRECGTIGFHKECYRTLIDPEALLPDSMYDEIRKHIISSDGNPFENALTGEKV